MSCQYSPQSSLTSQSTWYTELWWTQTRWIRIEKRSPMNGKRRDTKSDTCIDISGRGVIYCKRKTHEQYTHLVPSAFQLTLYGFCSRKRRFCLSMDTGWAPGKPDLQQQSTHTHTLYICVSNRHSFHSFDHRTLSAPASSINLVHA